MGLAVEGLVHFVRDSVVHASADVEGAVGSCCRDVEGLIGRVSADLAGIDSGNAMVPFAG